MLHSGTVTFGPAAPTVTTYADPAEFLAAARPILEAMPVESNVIATLAAEMVAGDSPYRHHRFFVVGGVAVGMLTEWGLATTPLIEPDGGTAGPQPDGDAAGPQPDGDAAAPQPDVEAAAAALVAAARATGLAIPRVSGVGAAAPAVVRVLTAAGATVAERTNMLVYDLVELVTPDAVPGSPRLAVPDDLDLVTRWLFAFHDEVEHGGRTDELRRHAENTVGDGRMMLWVDEARVPVSMAGVRPPALGLSRVGPVYTPPESRRRGYAGAVTAAVTARGFELGASRTMLFTDADFPTSNHVYQQLGYRRLGEAHMIVLTTPTAPTTPTTG